jgi:phosphoglycolate phosphatase-like HAD superfamily hydrolase
MIGDTPYDVEAALRAGVPIVTVRCGGNWTDADLRGSVSTFDDPADILAHYEFLLHLSATTQKKNDKQE